MAPGTPWSDMTGNGDSYAANEFVDNVFVSNRGWLGAAARLYAGAYGLREPLLSPIFGDLRGLPPAILTRRARELFLSNTVRMRRKLRRAGVEAALQVFEGESPHSIWPTPTPRRRGRPSRRSPVFSTPIWGDDRPAHRGGASLSPARPLDDIRRVAL